MSDKKMIYQQPLSGAGMWSKVIGRGKTLRMTATSERVNVGMLLYNALEKHERYNMPDTLKGQHIFYLTHPYCLHSDMGRLFASITKDTFGWHDTVCGASDADLVEEKYGKKSYQEVGNDYHQNAQRCFLIELAKWGLGKKDLIPNINWFSKIVADAKGNLKYVPQSNTRNSVVELRMELDTLVVLNTCQHPLDPTFDYQSGEVLLEVFNTEDFDHERDACLTSRPENRRAFENNEAYHALRF